MAASAATEITIPDAELRSCINNRLGQPADAPITQDQADGVVLLYCTSPDLADLSGIEALQNLLTFNSFDNDLTSIAPLGALTYLTDLNIEIRNVTDIGPLANLTNLTSLSLRNSQVSDVSPLASLVSLQDLYLTGSQVSDVSPLASLGSLQELALTDSQVSDVSPLADLGSLRELYLDGNQISDISPLSSLSLLQVLSLTHNLLSGSAPVSGFPLLQMIDLSDNQISDLSSLVNLPSLQELYVNNNLVIEISLPADLTSLSRLRLSDNQIESVEPLAVYPNLRRVWLDGNNISDLSPLAGLTKLVLLNMDNNHISDLSVLKPLVGGLLTILDVKEQTIQLPQTTVGQREALALASIYGEPVVPESATASVNAEDGSWVLPTPGEHTLTWATGTEEEVVFPPEDAVGTPREKVDSDRFTGTIIQTAEEAPAASGLAVVGPSDVTVAEGDTAVFTSSASSDSGKNAPRWEQSTDGGVTWAEVPGPWTDTLRVENSSSTLTGNMFRVEYTNDSDGAVVVSDPARLTVVAKTPPQPKPPVDLPASPGGELAASGAQHAASVWAGVLAAMLLGVFLIGNSVRRSRALPREQ